MNTTWSKPTKYIVGVGLALLGLYIFYLISRSVLTLLVLAALIAFLVRPIITFLHKQLKLPRGVAVLFTYFLVLIIILLAPLILIPAIVDAINFVLRLDYQAFIRSGLEWLETTLISLREREIPIAALDNYVDSAIDSFLTSLQDAAPEIAPNPPSVSIIVSRLGSAMTMTFGIAAGVVGSVLSSVVLFVFMLLSSIYMSLSAPHFREQFMRMVPPAYQHEINTLLGRLGHIWVAFFRGQFTLMVIIGVVTWIGLTILGVPGALSLAIVAGLLEIIPNLGPILAAIPGVIVALLQGSTHFAINNLVFALIVIFFYWMVQNLENSIIVPKVLGDAVELPPLVVMTGVLVGASVGGILGALLATPVIASGKEIIQYIYHKMLDAEPFPAEEEVSTERTLSSSRLVSSLERLMTRLQHMVLRRPPSPPASQATPSGTPEEGQS